MKKTLLPLILFLFLASGSIFSQSQAEKYAISASELEEWVAFLASDHMKGRQNGSPEMEESAEWIVLKFKEFDVKPVYPDGKLVRPYTFQTRRGATVDERNIVGIIEGTDPRLKDEYIIITAHFDHVGIRRAVEGDSIYNGADDNAAGTCTLLGVAKTIKENNYKPGRTLLFASISGEEMGLHGSRYLVSNMPLPLQNAYANVNFEMTGHSEFLGTGNYYMTGCDFSNLDDVIQEFNRDKEHQLIDTIVVANRLFYASDNIAFGRLESGEGVSIGIPCGTFATTTSGEYIHTPQDEAELFDLGNMAGLVDHFADMLIWLSHSDQAIDWTDPKFKRPE
ncbi:MAG: M28 family peptidase [Bacteroidia bacterium]|nr:MAG: M28 family peptidase [Bacteroidia bacterium]